jgi:S-formylglutathione hydrolase FrmB
MFRNLWLAAPALLLAGLFVPFVKRSAAEEKAGAQARVLVRIGPALVAEPPESGRIVVVLSRRPANDLRGRIGRTGMNADPIFGMDGVELTADKTATIDARSSAFPVASLADLPAGDYTAQAVFMTNRDLNLVRAPGNLYSQPTPVRLGPNEAPRELVLSQREPPERMPADTDRVKYLKFPSKLLSDFHGRPMYYRAAVVLPSSFAAEPQRRYPLRVHIGGYGARFTAARNFVRAGGPQVLTLVLDGAGPYGDPYQVNSANNGPYGDALTQELIPHVEKTCRAIGQPHARFTDGASTGGWVSLALQIFYPDYFGGCWSQCPDPLDFRAYELINIYSDANAYVNARGFERPAMRNINGDTVYTVRHECQVENVLGRGDRWHLGGKDWCAWNATFGPRGNDGLPKPLWDPKTGIIDRSVTKHWEKYDLRLVVERNWPALAPKLDGKIRIWVGDADEYFLNNAVHLFKEMTTKLSPPFVGRIEIEMRKGHTSGGWTEAQMLREMESLAEKGSGTPAPSPTSGKGEEEAQGSSAGEPPRQGGVGNSSVQLDPSPPRAQTLLGHACCESSVSEAGPAMATGRAAAA